LISKKLQPFGTTIFSEMTGLALKHGAINLSQGFPDFEGPEEILDAAARALRSGDNQYARSMGHLKLVEAIASHQEEHYGFTLDPTTEITVFSGATEGIASTLLGLLNPGDEIVIFEPFYDSYPACAALAGAKPRYSTLHFPDFSIDKEQIASLFNDRTRVLLLNTPHNPTGKVFSRKELEFIAELCIKYDVIAVTDEVYEHLVYDGLKHLSISEIDGMRERTISISSAGKTFSFTGWKVGWATGPKELIAAAQAAHQFVTFATATPLQLAVAFALTGLDKSYFSNLRRDYQAKRDFLASAIQDAGMTVVKPQGTYFIIADFSTIHQGDDRSFVRRLIEDYKVAAIPPSVFYNSDLVAGKSLVRFAFCKKMDTLQQASDRLKEIRL